MKSLGARDENRSCPAVSHISNLIKTFGRSGMRIFCVKNAATCQSHVFN